MGGSRLQVMDTHYADGRSTPCLDVLPDQLHGCSDLNTTAFIQRMILAEFTGDNVFGFDASDAAASMMAAFPSSMESGLLWAAVLGNHDQESTLSREGVMRHIVGLRGTRSRINPSVGCGGAVDIGGYGNYNLEVGGVEGSSTANKSALNLYLLDSRDYSTVLSIPGYGWIKPSQHFWLQQTSAKLQKAYTGSEAACARAGLLRLLHFHIPLPELSSFNFTGVKQEGISSASVTSGFFATMMAAGDLKAVFTGHDHFNDFLGQLNDISLCYAGARPGGRGGRGCCCPRWKRGRTAGGLRSSPSRLGSGWTMVSYPPLMHRHCGTRPLPECEGVVDAQDLSFVKAKAVRSLEQRPPNGCYFSMPPCER